MTISILAIDEKTGWIGGAAATGSLCVGGWVLRGHANSGVSASQGTAPSTLWGEDVLARMRDGEDAVAAVAAVTKPDTGRAHRQLAAVDKRGGTAAFTGAESVYYAGEAEAPGVVVAGNMLSGPEVVSAALEACLRSESSLPERLLAALDAAAAAGGDARGLCSAALLVVGRSIAPLSLRIDHAACPLAELSDLYRVSQTDPYHGWTQVVPVLDDPCRAPISRDVPDVPEPIVASAPSLRR